MWVLPRSQKGGKISDSGHSAPQLAALLLQENCVNDKCAFLIQVIGMLHSISCLFYFSQHKSSLKIFRVVLVFSFLPYHSFSCLVWCILLSSSSSHLDEVCAALHLVLLPSHRPADGLRYYCKRGDKRIKLEAGVLLHASGCAAHWQTDFGAIPALRMLKHRGVTS